MDDAIDFVIIWVDGNDLKWKRERGLYQNNKTDDNREVRYRDWDNLQYIFRGIEKFAPWVNKIHFVTYGHLPKWLNTEHHKLNIVRHEDYIPTEYLPTFNSHTIELNLHRIKDLTEKFVYFNDDIFICKDLQKTDFFIKDKPCDSGILSPAIQENKMGIGNVILNNMGIINEHFNKNTQIKQKKSNWLNIKYGKQNIKNILLFPWEKFTGFYEMHIASSFLKSTFQTIWGLEFNELNNTSKHKFRNLKQDVNQWIIRDWQLASNNFIPRETNFGRNFNLELEFEEAISAIINQKYKMICLNDSDDIKNYEDKKIEIIKSLEKILPDKSKFEK